MGMYMPTVLLQHFADLPMLLECRCMERGPTSAFILGIDVCRSSNSTLEATTESTPSRQPQHTCTLLQEVGHDVVKAPERCCGCWACRQCVNSLDHYKCVITNITFAWSLMLEQVVCFIIKTRTVIDLVWCARPSLMEGSSLISNGRLFRAWSSQSDSLITLSKTKCIIICASIQFMELEAMVTCAGNSLAYTLTNHYWHSLTAS